jgi:hypothetical protein
MKNLQSLLTEKGIQVLVDNQMTLVKGGKRGRGKRSNKSGNSCKSGKNNFVVTPTPTPTPTPMPTPTPLPKEA